MFKSLIAAVMMASVAFSVGACTKKAEEAAPAADAQDAATEAAPTGDAPAPAAPKPEAEKPET